MLSFLANVLQAFWGLSDTQAATIFSSVFVGQVIGTLTLGPLADRFGRRPTFLITSVLISVFGFLTASANAYGLLIVFRLIVGIGVGAVTIPFDLLSECTPQETRGRDLVLIEFFWAAGELFVLLLAYLFLGVEGTYSTNPNGWRIFVAIAAVPILLSTLLGYLWVPESPRWLLARGHHDRALEILRNAAETNGKDPDEVFPPGTKLHEGKEQELSDPRELLKPAWRKVTILIWVLWLASSFAYYGVIELATKVFSSSGSGSDPTAYSFEYGPLAVNTSADVFGIALALFYIERWGRVNVQVGTYVVGGFFLLAFGLVVYNNSIVPVLTFVSFAGRICYAAGIAVTWAATVELLPTGLRATGHSSANLMGELGGLVAPYIIDSSISMIVIGLIFMVVSFMGAASAWLLPETQGRRMGEVVVHWDSTKTGSCTNNDDLQENTGCEP